AGPSLFRPPRGRVVSWSPSKHGPDAGNPGPMSLSVIILAAGQGKRMHSDLPKVSQPLGGATLLTHVVRAAAGLLPGKTLVVYGHGGEAVRESHKALGVEWVLQAEQLGTGHAVMQALPGLKDGDTAIILYGDVPLVRTATLKRLADSAAQ